MSGQKINIEFIESIRTSLSLKNWIYDNSDRKVEIVSEELTHSHLFKNFNIDLDILEYYCIPTRDLLSEKEFQELVKSGFVGKQETALYPYSNIIYGAYYSRSDLYMKLLGLTNEERPKKINGIEINYFSDLIPYFKEYATGFEDGFNNFDETQIKPYLTLLAEKEDYINKVFDFVTKNIFLGNSWAYSRKGFVTNQNDEIIKAFENGQEQGYFYKAWSIIFSNSVLFANLFKELVKSQKNIDSCQINDNEFLKGKIKLKFVPQYDDGYYEVTKGDEKRKFSLIKYFEICLGNSTAFIDCLKSKEDKIKATNNAIFDLQKDHYDNDHPEILRLIEKNINYLKNSITCIESNFKEGVQHQHNDLQELKENKTNAIIELETENDLVLSTIEDWLYEFKDENVLLEKDYKTLVEALKQYFDIGEFPKLKYKIKVKKINKKRFGWALNEIFRANKDNNEKLPMEYLEFASEYISIFKNVSFDKIDYLKSNLYKYFTTKIN